MVPRWPIFGVFLGPAFSVSRAQYVSDLRSKFALGPHHDAEVYSQGWSIRH